MLGVNAILRGSVLACSVLVSFAVVASAQDATAVLDLLFEEEEVDEVSSEGAVLGSDIMMIEELEEPSDFNTPASFETLEPQATQATQAPAGKAPTAAPPSTTPPPKKTPPPAPTPAPRVPPAPQEPQPLPPSAMTPFANEQTPPFVQTNPRYLSRVSRTPDMFGDSLITTQARVTNANADDFNVDLPFNGGGRRFKNEHSQALPVDRIFGLYHRFTDAMRVATPDRAITQSVKSVDRFTVGFEKTFFDRNASIEVRLPMSVPLNVSTPDVVYQSDVLGDLVVNLKGLLYADEDQAFSLGIAAVAPTGGDAQVFAPQSGTTGASFTFRNDAGHLVPYAAYQMTPTEDFFLISYLQIDTPTNSNSVKSVVTTDTAGDSVRHFQVTDQTLMYADLTFGHWWIKDSEASFLTGLATLLELHYTTQLNGQDVVKTRDSFLSFGNRSGSDEVLNLTFGAHLELQSSTFLRVGYVRPIRGPNHRFFDDELTVALVFRR